MKTVIALTIFSVFLNSNILTYAQNDSTNTYKTQISFYTSLFGQINISEAHGNHGSYMGQPIDATVNGIKINYNWGIGVNSKIYLYKNINLQLDLLYSDLVFPDQDVILDGNNITQHQSDLNFFTLSVGPGFRYIGEGIFQKLNPYAFISFSALLGYANNVSYFMSSGQNSYSFVSGVGYNINIGSQYFIGRFIIALDYRFEYLNSKVDNFRSFTDGLYYIKSSSYIFLELGFAL